MQLRYCNFYKKIYFLILSVPLTDGFWKVLQIGDFEIGLNLFLLQNSNKIRIQCQVFFGSINDYWWRRRELNPRPKALLSGFYMLIPPFKSRIMKRRQTGFPLSHPLCSHPALWRKGAEPACFMTLFLKHRQFQGSVPLI
jgi:hypothetical protein